MHNKEISLVEVGVYKYKVGDKLDSEFLDSNLEWSYPNWQDCIDDLPNPTNYLDVIVTQDFYGFVFTFVGESFDDIYAGGLHWEYGEGLQGETFSDWEADLIKYAEVKFEDYKKKQELLRNPNYDVNFVRFVTAWEWTSYEDSYNHEFESEWNLLGLVNLDDITKIVK